jgi:hypothetical protein
MNVTQNIETQKLWLIQQLLLVQDLALIEQLKSVLSAHTATLLPMSWGELQNRIDNSEEDYQNQNYVTTEELENEIENW